jgi:hypothetical protein
MNNYLQQIALRSGGAEGSNDSTTLPITPHASGFGEEQLIEKGLHDEWGEVFEAGEDDQATLPVHNASATHEQSLKPLATNAETPLSYLKAQVQRGPSASNLYVDKRTAIPAPTMMAPNGEPSAVEKPSIQKKHVITEHIQKMEIADKESGGHAVGLKQHMKPLTGTPFNKTIREQHVIQPNATVPIPAVPTIKKVENKLVIGKITVEVVKPAVQTKERVVVRTYQAAPATGHQDRNKLSFGLGQL